MLIHNNAKVVKYKSDPQITYTIYAVQDAKDGLTLSDDMILVSDIENKYVAIGYALASLTYTKFTDIFIVETIYINDTIEGSRVVWQAQVDSSTTVDNFRLQEEFI